MNCLCLTFDSVASSLPYLPKLLEGVEVVELRVDLWQSYEHDFVAKEIALFRQHSALPILFTVRSQRDGGKFPNQEKAIFELLHLAVSLNCEYVDMEIGWSKDLQKKLIKQKQNSLIVASFHNFETTYTDYGLRHVARRCLYTRADIVKIATFANNFEDNLRIFELIRYVKSKYKKPIIALAMGQQGKLSRLFGAKIGSLMTLITHELLPVKAAPGQISYQDWLDFQKLI